MLIFCAAMAMDDKQNILSCLRTIPGYVNDLLKQYPPRPYGAAEDIALVNH